jgi:DNA-binding NarL/FixJ family response regulator
MGLSRSYRERLSGTRVLLVEDNFLAGIAVRSLLERIGCAVSGPYPTADEALLVARAAQFDAGVLDIALRGGTSEAVAQELLKQGHPFLLVSGYESFEGLPDVFDHGVMLKKPVDDVTLWRALEAALGGPAEPHARPLP